MNALAIRNKFPQYFKKITRNGVVTISVAFFFLVLFCCQLSQVRIQCLAVIQRLHRIAGRCSFDVSPKRWFLVHFLHLPQSNG